ncbi:MAG: molybdopterin-binding protein [Desulfobacteraceae bacterium]|nr:molybdopterin-binding protein [Desulfobacteraceae bacterium]
MKVVPVRDAVGMVLCHDITRIVPGESKGPAFRKGHVIRDEDLPVLRDLGKENIFVFELDPGWIHENEAARRIARAAVGQGIHRGEPVEGKVDLVASGPGLLKIDLEGLKRINSLGDVILATLHTHQPVTEGCKLAGTRIIPLVTEESRVEEVEGICRDHDPVLQVLPFAAYRVGLVTTGTEVYSGRIRDGFGPVIRRKFAELGSAVFRQEFVSDDVEMTVKAIRGLLDDGAQMITVTGGMSVDPDDRTPASIRAAGGREMVYGAPVLPGAMFLLAAIDGVPVLGLPGCVMYHRRSIFDLVVPRILAGETVTREDIAALGHGGLCRVCTDCRYPACGFGKGGMAV